MLGAEVPGHRQEQLTQTLMVRLLKTHLFSLFQILEIVLRFYKLTSDHTLLAKQLPPPLLQSSSPECCLGMEAVAH